MKGIIKRIMRSEWFVENSSDHYKHDSHPVRHTNTYAKLDDGSCVNIDEGDIRRCFGQQRITDKVIRTLNEKLGGQEVEYEKNEDGDNILKDFLFNILQL